jgi:hypothetical protein
MSITTYVLFRRWPGYAYLEPHLEETDVASLEEAAERFAERLKTSDRPVREREVMAIALRQEKTARMPLHLFVAEPRTPTVKRLPLDDIVRSGSPASGDER